MSLRQKEKKEPTETPYRLIVRCIHCPIPVAQYDFSFEQLVDYVQKGLTRPHHWGWIKHRGYIYQGKREEKTE